MVGLPIIDADAHVTEARDLWTKRVSTAKWGDQVPHVRTLDDVRGTALEALQFMGRTEFAKYEAWFVGDALIAPVAASAPAGWSEPFPSHPPTLEDAMRAAHDPVARIALMDESGITAQVLYPNVGGFGSERFRAMEPELGFACVRAYNDFLVEEFTSVAPERLIAIAAIPYWNVEEAVKEIYRIADLGHRGIIFPGAPQDWQQPWMASPHWHPIWAAVQECDLPVSFHAGSGSWTGNFQPDRVALEGISAAYVRSTATIFFDSAKQLCDLTMSGVLARFPNLKFVAVEAGIGWIPFMLETLDFFYKDHVGELRSQRPELAMLPSEYFHRQVYACGLFAHQELPTPELVEAVGADKVLFETDFPHPSSAFGMDVQTAASKSLAGLPPAMQEKIRYQNAAELYKVNVDALLPA